jgi:uncharacterized membrane protein YcjF (UPF0283 family)
MNIIIVILALVDMALIMWAGWWMIKLISNAYKEKP